MKTIQSVLCMAIFLFVAITHLDAQTVSDQDSTGLPGDNFSLQGALEMFKKAGSPEEFEKLLNTKDNNVNNLDLNGDGEIDYIRVIDKMDKDTHAFVLQVPVSEKENQDIAVIELQKTGDTTAILQILGDEDIFGEQTIVEPDGGGNGDEEGVDGKGDGGGPNVREVSYTALYKPWMGVNVWFWPGVRFVYAPAYRVWASPWRWHAYPGWWRPWRPLAWRVYHPFRLRFAPGFVAVHTNRVLSAHRIYAPVRRTSVIVRTRHHAAITHYRTTRTTTIRTKHGVMREKSVKRTTRVRGRRR